MLHLPSFLAAIAVVAPALAQPPAVEPQATAAAQAQPATAAMALDRAAAAYEYGDMTEVVDAARPVAEGALPATAAERTQALRLLGIGLYLTKRTAGAEIAFTELLRHDPRARLDPTITRPEVVAFFEQLRRRQRETTRRDRSFLLNLLPPLGQFQNGDRGRGIALIGVGAASAAVAITTRLMLASSERDDHTFGDGMPDDTRGAERLRIANWIAVGALAATYVVGVADGMLRYDRRDDDGETVTLILLPGGGGVRLTF